MTRRETAHGFTAVDSQADPARWVRCLDTLCADPFYVSYKGRIREIMRSLRGSRYLDVGAGTGEDARALARASGATVVAVDLSLTMATEARRRGLASALVGTASALPFRDGAFDGCWADRVFQHLDSPSTALRELVRVTRVGGRVALLDPDYGTQALEFPDQGLASKVLRFRAERGLRNGMLAARMGKLFSETGLTDVQCEPMTLRVRDANALDNVFGLRTWARSAESVGYLTRSEALRWEALFDEVVTAGGFRWEVTFFLTVGRKAA